MNDFTKEELQLLLRYSEHTNEIYKQERIDIVLKIQSMIDNYCDHEWQYNQHEQGHCIKCGVNE